MNVKNAIVATSVLLVFFGFPMAGMIYFWQDAHRKVEGRGMEFILKVEKPLFEDWNWSVVKDEIAPVAVGKITQAQLDGYKAQLGALQGPMTWQEGRMTVGERDDSVVSLVKAVGKGHFAKGDATFDLTVSHITTTADWKIESLALEK